MKTDGYSGTPLERKLGIKTGLKLKLVNAPEYYFELFTAFPPDIILLDDSKTKKDLIHYFSINAANYADDIVKLKNEIVSNGSIWISWPKKSSAIKSDLDENIIRELALKNGLVDVKVCAVDATWSALKLVIPLKDRK